VMKFFLYFHTLCSVFQETIYS